MTRHADQTVRVELANRSYDISIGDGILARSGPAIAALLRRPFTVIVTDSNVASHHLAGLEAVLATAGITHEHIILPPGEHTKSFAHLEQLCRALLAHELERSDTIIALGGGVIGDLVGFAAAILKRGCNFIQIPTTLLAQVDSSVGGKTAIDTPEGKNLIGAFHQPSLVIADTRLLETLPSRQMRAGYAEIVKYGLIDSPGFFEWLDQHGSDLLAGESTALAHGVRESCLRKAAIVTEDERETTGARALLNLGHTFGHALEAELGFGETLLHGEAVAIGCALAFGYSAHVGLCPNHDLQRLLAHLKRLGLPVHPRQAGITCSGARLVHHMMQDKKRSGGTLPFVLARGIGAAYLAKDVALESISAYLDQVIASPVML
jgi:3-dehydroquinate synthase